MASSWLFKFYRSSSTNQTGRRRLGVTALLRRVRDYNLAIMCSRKKRVERTPRR